MKKKFKCGFPQCIKKGIEFERYVIYHPGWGSTMVSCPNCGNFIPTWEKEEITDQYGAKKKRRIDRE